MGEAIAGLDTNLRRATDTPSLMAITATAARLRVGSAEIKGQTDTVAGEVATLAAQVDELVGGLQGPVGNSAALVERLAQVRRDLDGLNGVDRHDPTVLKLLADVIRAQQIAAEVNRELTDLQQRAQAVATHVHTLRLDVVALQNQVTALAVAAVANVQGTIQGQLETAVVGLDARIAQAERRRHGKY
jgi:hypothetical protein